MGTASDWLEINAYADGMGQSAAVPFTEKKPRRRERVRGIYFSGDAGGGIRHLR